MGNKTKIYNVQLCCSLLIRSSWTFRILSTASWTMALALWTEQNKFFLGLCWFDRTEWTDLWALSSHRTQLQFSLHFGLGHEIACKKQNRCPQIYSAQEVTLPHLLTMWNWLWPFVCCGTPYTAHSNAHTDLHGKLGKVWWFLGYLTSYKHQYNISV